MMNALAILIGYFLGTIPTAYFIIRKVEGKNILDEGTGNVGSMNAYEVSGKRWLGISVAVIDALKGMLAVGIGRLLDSEHFITPALAGFFAVMGHNYNIFLKMRGGRGLATATGVFLMLNPIPIVLFCCMWLTGFYVVRRHVHVGNAVGAAGGAVLIFNAPDNLIRAFTFVPLQDPMQVQGLAIMIFLQILMRHLQPLRELPSSTAEE